MTTVAPSRSGPRAVDVVLTLAVALAVASQTLLTGAFGDWEVEAQPVVQALLRGDLAAWAAALPAYAGGMTLRAPGQALGGWLGGGDLDWVFRIDALPAIAAMVALGLVLAARLRAGGRSLLAVALVPVALLAAPTTLAALRTGHPEELLGAVLCVAAVVAAARRGRWSAALAGVLLGLAVANKAWAVLAVLPVAAVLPAGWPLVRAACFAAATLAVVLLPSTLIGGTSHVAMVAAAGDAAIFKPAQVFWFFGEPGYVQPSPFGPIADRRAGPEWAAAISQPLIVVLGAALAAIWWWRTPARARTAAGGAVLLAAVLWWRCVLDTWNADYYLVPSLAALLTAEVLRGRAPIATCVAAALAGVTIVSPDRFGLGSDAQTLAHLAWALPFGVALTVTALRPDLARRVLARASRRGGRLLSRRRRGPSGSPSTAPVAPRP